MQKKCAKKEQKGINLEEVKRSGGKSSIKKGRGHAFAHRRDKRMNEKALNVRNECSPKRTRNYIQQIHQRFKRKKDIKLGQKDNGRPSRKIIQLF